MTAQPPTLATTAASFTSGAAQVARNPAALATPLPPRPRRWWDDAVVYQVYPRSFADADGNGIGDLAGVTSRADYLAALGIDAVWLSPFYPSSLHDGGYDVDDYRDVAPEIGTLSDFDAMVTALHDRGIRVIVDVVPNHSSIHHPWFTTALAGGPDAPERALYHVRDGLGPDGTEPPNDWRSMFGGSIWERIEDRAGGLPDGAPLTGPGTGRPYQYYLHTFAPEQADLNWDHPRVRADFEATLRFWCDRGVDGFRVDMAPGLVKDMSEPYRPMAEIPWWPLPDDGSHPLFDRDAVHEVYHSWRALLDEYAPPRSAVAEAGVRPTRRAAYAASLGQAFNFQMQDADFTPASYRWAIEAGLADEADCGSTTWVLGCHDAPRVATRYGFDLADDVLPDGEVPFPGGAAQRMVRRWLQADGAAPSCDAAAGERRARAGALVVMALPGSMYLYQGDELGLPEVPDLPEDVLRDPIARRNRHVEKGRDGCRVPLPWAAEGSSYGFGPDGGAAAHLPQPVGWGSHAVEVEAAAPVTDPTGVAGTLSTLALYRRGLALRRLLWGGPGGDGDPAPAPAAADVPAPGTPAVGETVGEPLLTWVDAPAHVLAFRRGDVECWTAFGESAALPDGEVLVASAPLPPGILPADTTVWVRRP